MLWLVLNYGANSRVFGLKDVEEFRDIINSDLAKWNHANPTEGSCVAGWKILRRTLV